MGERDDVGLAHACAAGDAAAIAELEQRYFGAVVAALRAHRASADLIDETMQMLREALFVAPRDIASFRGQGPLSGFLRVIALRIFVRLAQRARRAEPLEERLLEQLPAAALPGLSGRHREHAGALVDALRAAAGRLTREQRNLLRFRFLDHLTVDEIAAIKRVHRATAARWVLKAEDALVTAVRELAGARIGAASGELLSLLRSARGEVAFSAASLLREPA
jgi:RNA polymerase sigma-70 factor (ECF subfamily)